MSGPTKAELRTELDSARSELARARDELACAREQWAEEGDRASGAAEELERLQARLGTQLEVIVRPREGQEGALNTWSGLRGPVPESPHVRAARVGQVSLSDLPQAAELGQVKVLRVVP